MKMIFYKFHYRQTRTGPMKQNVFCTNVDLLCKHFFVAFDAISVWTLANMVPLYFDIILKHHYRHELADQQSNLQLFPLVLYAFVYYCAPVTVGSHWLLTSFENYLLSLCHKRGYLLLQLTYGRYHHPDTNVTSVFLELMSVFH